MIKDHQILLTNIHEGMKKNSGTFELLLGSCTKLIFYRNLSSFKNRYMQNNCLVNWAVHHVRPSRLRSSIEQFIIVISLLKFGKYLNQKLRFINEFIHIKLYFWYMLKRESAVVQKCLAINKFHRNWKRAWQP